jgi:hypothetical protein
LPTSTPYFSRSSFIHCSGDRQTSSWEIAGDVHAHDGSGIPNVNHVEWLTDAGLGCKDPNAGVTDDHNGVDIDENDANAMTWVVFEVHVGV